MNSEVDEAGRLAADYADKREFITEPGAVATAFKDRKLSRSGPRTNKKLVGSWGISRAYDL